MFQVGAPRGNVSTLKVKEPGAVFRCGLYFCREFILDDAGNVPGTNYYYRYKDRKDEGWVGVSMDMKYANNTLKTIVSGSGPPFISVRCSTFNFSLVLLRSAGIVGRIRI